MRNHKNQSIIASLESIRTLPRTGTPGKWSNVASNDIHSDWLIFTLSCTGQKINKNKEFTADVVFHLLAMHRVQMSNFWRLPEPKNPAKACQYIHGGWVFFTALGRSKKLKNEDSTVHAVFYLIVMHRVWMSNQCPIFEDRRSPKTRWRLVNTSTVTGYFLQCSGPVKKIKKWGFYSPCSILSDSNAPGLDVQFLKIAGARKPGEGMSIHLRWPSIFYNALGWSKKLKNEDSTAHAVFYPIVMHRVRMSNFWTLPELKNSAKA